LSIIKTFVHIKCFVDAEWLELILFVDMSLRHKSSYIAE
jgi:hypothetical protein